MKILKEVFKGVIPPDKYSALVRNGESTGLTIQLEGQKNNIVIEFGAVSALRMLDEGIVLENAFLGEEVDELPDKFDNTIYAVNQGEFGAFVRKIGNELYDYLELKHYIIFTMNYVIEVVTRWQPEITINGEAGEGKGRA